MKRRDFIKTSVMAGAALTLNFDKLGAALSSNSMAVEQVPDMVAIMGGEPEVMLDKALNELGGIGNYIKKGNLSSNEIIYLYARLLFPSEFMALAINEDCNDLRIKKKLLLMYQNIDYERQRLIIAIDLLNDYVKLPRIAWLEH